MLQTLYGLSKQQAEFQVMDRSHLRPVPWLLDGADKTDATNRGRYSMRLICEAELRLANAPYAIEHAIKGLTIYCRSISHKHGQYELDFVAATAAIRAHEKGLLIRVEAEETVISDGTKMLITSQISSYATNMPMNVLWVDASEEPFAAILSLKDI